MLVYVNNFTLNGENALDNALQSVCGWIKFKTGSYFDIDMLKAGSNYKFDNITVRTFCAVSIEPEMYSILLTHPDKDIHGRYWETEIGIKNENGMVAFSILLKVNDISTQVRGNVITTRPLLVKYLFDNGLLNPNTVGLKTTTLNSEDNIRALKWEIFKPERNYPLVLISKNKKINPTRLQEQLIGLAKVIVFPRDTYDGLMERELTRRYSAWDGAINIIQPLFGGREPRNSLILSEQINLWWKNKVNVLYELLSIVTHSTNKTYRKEHFSPTDVRAKRQKDQRIALINKISLLSDDSDYKQALEEAMKELESQLDVSNAEIDKLTNAVAAADSLYYDSESSRQELDNMLIALNAKIECYDNLFKTQSVGEPALIKGNEKDLYLGEIKNILIDAIKKQLDSAKNHSRRKDVLKDIIDHNPTSELKSKFFDELKKELKDYKSLTPKLREIFAITNIEVISDGNHNKAQFVGESRYKVTFAKTASDSHAGRNNITIIRDNLF